ncbi:MAG: Gfo/Idh/MocA family protein [Aristaeellaceae bacterium]
MDAIRVALFGVGGYAANYPIALARPSREGVRLVGAVDPYSKACDLCPVYDTAEELFSRCQPDLAVIATPIHCHAAQAEAAFRHGCHVLLEKPMAPDMDGARRILEARDRAGKMLGVGFNLCASSTVRAVRADAKAGVFGRPLRLKILVLWPRDHTYYHRGSGWAGKRYAPDGAPIFDSVLSNATAHYLMNMLYLLDEPLTHLDCATFRANAIETYDTAFLKGFTASGAEVYAAVSHAVDPDCVQNPIFHYEYEKATLTFGGRGITGSSLVARFADGTEKDYGVVDLRGQQPLWNMIDAIRGQAEIACPGETAMLHVDAIGKMRLHQPDAADFPEGWKAEKRGFTCVPGLAEAMYRCYDEWTLPRWDLAAERLVAP